MSINKPVRFSYRNTVPDSVITGTAPSAGSLDNLKNHYRAQYATWEAPALIEINGTSPGNKVCDAFTLLHHDITPRFVNRLTLYSGEGLSGDVVYDSRLFHINEQAPIGQWRFGVDPFGTVRLLGNPFTLWLDSPKIFKSWRLLVIRAEGTDDVNIGMLHFGLSTRLSDSFDWGAMLSHYRQAEVQTTQSGGAVAVQNQLRGKRMQFDLAQMSDGDRLAITDLESAVNGGHFVVSAQPDAAISWQESDGSFLARFETNLVHSYKFHGWHGLEGVTLTEV